MDEFAREVNNLLVYLRGFQVVKTVEQYYSYFHNDAPPQILQDQINKVQQLLDQLTKGERQ